MASKITSIDSYKQFFDQFPKESFFQFGLDNIISIERDIAQRIWFQLKDGIDKYSKTIFVRSSGRNASGNSILQKLYKDVFNIDVKFDPTNNAKATQMLQKATGHEKNKTIFNYQVAHVFGRTKNMYCFTAPWNVVFIPKMVDPFTGHEAIGTYVDEFKKLFVEKIYSKYKDMIEEYNEIMHRCKPKVNDWLFANVDTTKVQDYLKDFEEIKSVNLNG